MCCCCCCVLFSAAVAAAAGVSPIVVTVAWAMVRRAPRSPRFTTTALASQDSRTPKIPRGFIRILASPVLSNNTSHGRPGRPALATPGQQYHSKYGTLFGRQGSPGSILHRHIHPRTLDTHVQQGLQDDSLAWTAYRGALACLGACSGLGRV